jgi:hypothetical protein
MAGLVPIQLGNAINRPTGSPASSTDEAEPVDSFAAVLSGHFSRRSEATAPFAAMKLTALDSPEHGEGLEPLLPAATKQSDRWPLTAGSGPGPLQLAAAKPSGSGSFNTTNGQEALPLGSAGSGVFNPVPGSKTTPRSRQEPATSSNGPLATTGNPGGTPVTKPELSVADEMTMPADHGGMDPGSLNSNGKVQTSLQNSNTVVTIISEADFALPLDNKKNGDLQGETAALSPVVPPGKKSDGGTGTHVKTHLRSAEQSVPAAKGQVGDVVPVSVAVAPAPQLPVGTVSPPIPVPLPPASDAPVAVAASQIRVGGGDQPAGRERPVAVDGGKAQLASEQPSAAVPPPGTPLTTIEPQKFADRSDVAPESPHSPRQQVCLRCLPL